jgi:hypothetical protein
MTPEQTLTAVYHDMLAIAEAHITLDVEPDLEPDGLTGHEWAFLQLGVDIGWTATLTTLRDHDLLAKETT